MYGLFILLKYMYCVAHVAFIFNTECPKGTLSGEHEVSNYVMFILLFFEYTCNYYSPKEADSYVAEFARAQQMQQSIGSNYSSIAKCILIH